jgi:non-heme chloroperoxidase
MLELRIVAKRLGLPALTMLLALSLTAQQQTPPKQADHSSHTVQFVTVEKDVKLEVLDWDGQGRPLVFLAGGGLDAHEFDDFAPKFTATHHVYAITRRGFGASSAPKPDGSNYSGDRYGDDVLAVMAALKIDHPVLVGHSLGGAELSSVGSRYPDKIAGLIYLDAAYSYAFYSESVGDPIIDLLDLQQRLASVLSVGYGDAASVHELEQVTARLDKDLCRMEATRKLMPPQPPRPAATISPVAMAYARGRQKYTALHVPILAIFADPHDHGALYQDNPAARVAVIANDRETTDAEVEAFQAGVPNAHVVRIPNADHFLFKSNEAEVMREMTAFLASLPEAPSKIKVARPEEVP